MNSLQAINLLNGLEQSLEDYCELNDEGKEAFRVAVTALELFGNAEQLPSAQPLVLTCDGCRHVGTYDTDFPCSGCIRREKDYYEQER